MLSYQNIDAQASLPTYPPTAIDNNIYHSNHFALVAVLWYTD